MTGQRMGGYSLAYISTGTNSLLNLFMNGCQCAGCHIIQAHPKFALSVKERKKPSITSMHVK
eukprot:11872048-Ditylum_brightwellii.AAC.1